MVRNVLKFVQHSTFRTFNERMSNDPTLFLPTVNLLQSLVITISVRFSHFDLSAWREATNFKCVTLAKLINTITVRNFLRDTYFSTFRTLKGQVQENLPLPQSNHNA